MDHPQAPRSKRKDHPPKDRPELADPCHERTLRRDLDALGLAGFPIYSERENGKSYWKLDENYRRSPLPLTATELYALQCGKHLLAPLEGTFITEALQSLYQKINANLTPKNREYLSLLQQTVQIGIPPYKAYQANRSLIEKTKKAIEEGKTIKIYYTSLRRGQPIWKKVNPYRLWFYNGALYLIGYSHERKDVRMFAIDRIDSLQITHQQFQFPLYFSIEDYFKDAFGVYRGEAEAVSLLFDKPASQWVRERKWHHSQRITPLRSGKIQLDLHVAVTPELMKWILGFGAQVEVLAPVRLRRMVENEAWRVVGRYQNEKMGRTRLRKKLFKSQKF